MDLKTLVEAEEKEFKALRIRLSVQDMVFYESRVVHIIEVTDTVHFTLNLES